MMINIMTEGKWVNAFFWYWLSHVVLDNSNTTTVVLWPFVRDYLGVPVPEETFTHPTSWSSSNLYQLLPSTTIHRASSLFKLYAWQSFCTTSLHVLFGLPLGMDPFVLDKMLLNDFCYNEIQTMFGVFLWLPLRSTGQAIMFYYIVSVLFFRLQYTRRIILCWQWVVTSSIRMPESTTRT